MASSRAQRFLQPIDAIEIDYQSGSGTLLNEETLQAARDRIAAGEDPDRVAFDLAVDDEFRTAGSASSGNFGHGGRPGEVGGSSTGLAPATSKDKERMKALAIPPAWKNVHLSVDPKADLQATGIDAKGRTQYRYSAQHSEKAAAEKFSRLKDFNKALPEIRSALQKDLHSNNEKEREAAAILSLIDKTGFRIGSTHDTQAEKQAYGASTLQANHVSIKGDSVTFEFIGKKGVSISKTVSDPNLAKLLAPRVAAGGSLFKATDQDVRHYLESKASGFTPKDFRTWHGTNVALSVIKGMPIPKNATQFKKAQKEVATTVANHLGNTPSVALKSYIAPEAFSSWKAKH